MPLQNDIRFVNSEHEMPVPKAHSPLRQLLEKNLLQKGIALLISLTLFFVVMSDRNMTTTYESIPVTLRVPEGFALRGGMSQQTVDIKIYGRASILRHVTRDELGSALVALPAREGNIQVTLNEEMLDLPNGVRIERFHPEFIGVNLEPIEKRRVTISTDHAFSGELLPGYQLGEVRLKPSEIELMGPKSVINETHQVYLEPINLTGKASSFVINRWVILNRVGLQAVDSPQIEVSVSILAKTRQQRVLGVPIEALNLSRSHQFIPTSLDLILIGEEQALAHIDTSKLFVTVDAQKDETSAAHVRVVERSELLIRNLPEGVSVDENRMPTVLLSIGNVKTEGERTRPADKVKPSEPSDSKEDKAAPIGLRETVPAS